MVAAVGLLAAVVAGCSANVPAIVLDEYSPGDGVGTELGEVAIRNLVVVSEGDGEPGVLVGALVSRAETDVNLLVQTDGGFERLVALEAGQTVQLGTGDGEEEFPGVVDSVAVPAVLEAVEPIAGDTLAVTVISETSGSVTLQAPITTPVREYATITPPAVVD